MACHRIDRLTPWPRAAPLPPWRFAWHGAFGSAPPELESRPEPFMISAARMCPTASRRPRRPRARRRFAVAAALALGCGAFAMAGLAMAQTRPAKPAAAPDTVKERSQELDAVRAEQRRAAEAEQKLVTENDSLAEDRRKLNQSLIDTAVRIRSSEEHIAAAEAHLRQLDGSEKELRRTLDGRRAVIAEVLAALQRMAHRPPAAVFAGTEDAIEFLARGDVAWGGLAGNAGRG